MKETFIFEYEQKIREFEEKIEQLILGFFREKKTGTTHEIVGYIRAHFPTFDEVYRKAPSKGLYRVRKILISLQRKGVLKKSELTISQIGKLPFLTYRWSLLKKE